MDNKLDYNVESYYDVGNQRTIYCVVGTSTGGNDTMSELWHRVDGPAVVFDDNINCRGITGRIWWLADRTYNLDDWLKVNTALTDEEKLMLKIQYG